MGARASHNSLVINDTIWVFGGAHFTGVNCSFISVYDIANSTWQALSTKNEPKLRYDHSIVRYKVSSNAWHASKHQSITFLVVPAAFLTSLF